MNALRDAPKVTLPLLIDEKLGVRDAEEVDLEAEMGTATDEPSSFADSASGNAEDSIAAAAGRPPRRKTTAA